MRYTDIYYALRKKGYRHNYTSTIDNLRFLVKSGKIIKVLKLYGIPTIDGDGNKYLTIEVEGQKATVKVE